ncbi:hypothetical protein E4U56_002966 [Claviceps arundinis]|uniref:Uncharacterized protein n=1 Tax=Claviceps arundinis TaxID=1623583 RepID=A0A9P7MZ50_9HYPO|nr:hypothetical protein E4U56_002966 [Claviceps arundinis]
MAGESLRSTSDSFIMVKILPFFLTTLAAIGPVAQAASCTPGLDYCGWVLLDHGGDRRSKKAHPETKIE